MYKKSGMIAVAALLYVGSALAGDQPLDVTISVVQSPNDLPAAVTKTIELPVAASDVGRERSAKGLDTANQAREFGRTFGQGIADEAKARRGRP
jgi:hypothetical protein